ncbi:hypothetical protein K440DRAFT_68306 [Wilcoxina mikolae CBS 423.85]|nr:hypothetical protein K440DRAFT_68306 [Wilcoxina mikolae CBS 423.85]
MSKESSVSDSPDNNFTHQIKPHTTKPNSWIVYEESDDAWSRQNAPLGQSVCSGEAIQQHDTIPGSIDIDPQKKLLPIFSQRTNFSSEQPIRAAKSVSHSRLSACNMTERSERTNFSFLLEPFLPVSKVLKKLPPGFPRASGQGQRRWCLRFPQPSTGGDGFEVEPKTSHNQAAKKKKGGRNIYWIGVKATPTRAVNDRTQTFGSRIEFSGGSVFFVTRAVRCGAITDSVSLPSRTGTSFFRCKKVEPGRNYKSIFFIYLLFPTARSEK